MSFPFLLSLSIPPHLHYLSLFCNLLSVFNDSRNFLGIKLQQFQSKQNPPNRPKDQTVVPLGRMKQGPRGSSDKAGMSLCFTAEAKRTGFPELSIQIPVELLSCVTSGNFADPPWATLSSSTRPEEHLPHGIATKMK